jgi:Fe-S cluster biogenesis protein NfuA
MQEHQRRAERIETLLQEVAAFPDAHARATTEELVQALLDLYGEGLARILELTTEYVHGASSSAAGPTLFETFASDDLVSSLLLLHGLHPLAIETRITRALDEVRPYLKSHGGNVEFIGVENGIAHLRLVGSCHGCSASAITLKSAIEEAIYKAAPDLDELRVEGVNETPVRTGMPVTFVPPRRHKEKESSHVSSVFPTQ